MFDPPFFISFYYFTDHHIVIVESRLIFSRIKTGFSRVYILTEIDVTESDVN